MVKRLLFALVVLVIFAGSFTSSSKALMLQVDELIIMVPEAEAGRNDRRISDALTAIPGVEVVGFCNSQKCFYMNIDRTQQPDNQNILTAIRSLGYGMEIKISGTIQEAQNNCADPN